MQQRDSASVRQDGHDWELFVAHLAEVANVAPDTVGRETRLVDDLNLDSLGLTEAVVVLLADLELEALPEALAAADWSKLTVGKVHEHCRGAARAPKVRIAPE